MPEFTVRALLLGLVMSVVLGAANAYLGLRAGMTIAATYPAAVIGMAVLRVLKGSLLEENFARTVGSIGESVAAGAIFTIPAFVVLKMWSFKSFNLTEYLTASALMIVGGILGVLFVTILRRVMVEDRSLPFPESVAAAEIHKAGQRGADAAMQLFGAMGVGALDQAARRRRRLPAPRTRSPSRSGRSRRASSGSGSRATRPQIAAGGVSTFQAPGVSPAYLGVGYIIGPELGALNFAGGLLAWGLFVPLLVFFLGPAARRRSTPPPTARRTGRRSPATSTASSSGRSRSAGCSSAPRFTLFRMRKNLALGLKRGIADVQKSATQQAATAAHRARPVVQDRPRRDRGRLRPDDRPLLLLHEGAARRDLRRDRDARHRLLLRRGVRATSSA